MMITLRAATDTDRPFLIWLEDICMRDYAVALWGFWKPEPETALAIEDHRIVVVKDQDVGCVAVVPFPDHFWVDKLYVAPVFNKSSSAR